jgi:two-component system response regulator FlrC
MNILIVDQNLTDRKNICGILENWGYHINITHDGNEAVEKIGSDTFLIIADHETPALNPIEFIKSTLKKNSDVKILFTSQVPSVENAVNMVKNGALDFVVKPVEEEYLRLSIDKILKDKAPAKKTVSKKKTKIVTDDPKMKQILGMIRQVADSTASIMIQGESGTGKELFARYIHENSNRSKKPFVAVNCAALPESLLESELF